MSETSAEDLFYATFPRVTYDGQGRISSVSVIGGAGIVTTSYDTSDEHDWSTQVWDQTVVSTYNYKTGTTSVSLAPAVTTASLDDGGRIVMDYRSIPAQYYRYDPQGALVERSSTVWFNNTTIVTHYDLASGLVTHETTQLDGGRNALAPFYAYRHVLADTAYDFTGAEPWMSITSNYTPISPDGQILTDTLARMDNGSMVRTSYDPAGQVDYTYTFTSVPNPGWPSLPPLPPLERVSVATDYDLTDQYDWSSYTLRTYAEDGTPMRTSLARMDDGSTVQDETLIRSFTTDWGFTYTTQYGRRLTFSTGDTPDHVIETHGQPPGTTRPDGDFSRREIFFVPGSTRMERSVTDYADGHYETVNYDPVTGGRAHVAMGFADGSTLAQAFDASGRLDYSILTERDGHVLIQDLDPMSGRVDVQAERFADGRSAVTDYDPATGYRDYAYTVGADGLVAARDYNPANDLPVFAMTALAGGRVLSERFDAAGRLDYSLLIHPDGAWTGQDFDPASGRVDFRTERLADGRVIATDYDLADQQPWASYTVEYDALGQVTAVSSA